MCQSGHSPVVTGKKKIPISHQDEYLVYMDSGEPEWDQTLALIMMFAIPEIKIKSVQKQCLLSRLFTKNLITENRGSKKEEFN